ncbi:transposase [Candidatus Dojkabacteria bacterium]|nr:transposase [Candidatus Dojkabacteria bacterium]
MPTWFLPYGGAGVLMLSMEEKGRKRQRLKGYDYKTPGFYFITTVVKTRPQILGKIKRNMFVLSDLGAIILGCWHDLPVHYSGIDLDAFIVMPDHLHGIIHLIEPEKNLSEIMRGFKSNSSWRINKRFPGRFEWQRSFYDHIIRNERDLQRVRNYIYFNVQKHKGHIGKHSLDPLPV